MYEPNLEVAVLSSVFSYLRKMLFYMYFCFVTETYLKVFVSENMILHFIHLFNIYNLLCEI